MGAPYLIVVCCGDSNAGSGETLDGAVDVSNSRVVLFDRATGNSTITGSEANLEGGTHGNLSMPANRVGSTIQLCQNLVTRGNVPAGFDIMVVGCAQAGTAFLNFWATTGNRACLDGASGLYAQVDAALALNTGNRIWFFDWNHGENDGGQTQAQYANNMSATFGEIRAHYNTAGGARAPILVTGNPPDRQDPLLGAQVNEGGVILAQQNIESTLDNAYYVDPTGLHSYLDNGFVHFSAASHRGGTDNSSTSGFAYSGVTAYVVGNHVIGSDNFIYYCNANVTGSDPTTDGGVHWTKTSYQWGLTVSNPLSERKYAKIIAAKYKFTTAW